MALVMGLFAFGRFLERKESGGSTGQQELLPQAISTQTRTSLALMDPDPG